MWAGEPFYRKLAQAICDNLNVTENVAERYMLEERIIDALRRVTGFELERFPGEANGQAKLTEADVLKIRADAAREPKGYVRRLSRIFGVSPGQICRIVRREKWKHI